VSDHTALILLATAFVLLAAALIAVGAGYLARRDHATWPHAITRAATAYGATLTLIAALATAVHVLLR
jgi:hypothetical protein